jgi:ADP-L-glycero-D-manno-heptose 6-epimerase
MDTKALLVVTGAAGFIGSCLVGYLNQYGYENLILVDEFSDEEKELNLHMKKYAVRVEREAFFDWLEREKPMIAFVFHLGARTDTTEFDYAVHQHLNVKYSQKIWNYCSEESIPLVYASSAATYGAGEAGYDDDHDKISTLVPLNPYGDSKNEFDKWALRQTQAPSTSSGPFDEPRTSSSKTSPPVWAGLKFFNVYGPNEYHKARMASMVYHSFNQLAKDGSVKLFKSHKEGFADGEQLRDFIYVKDVLQVCYWLMEQMSAKERKFESGIYNVGTGNARSFNDLISAVCSGLAIPVNIQYVDMPGDIRETYQYFTEANITKLRTSGYTAPFHTIEEGVTDYVKNYLSQNRYF